MARVCVVTPGRRLGRLLQRRLAELAAAQSRWFSPPRLITPVQIADAVLGLGDLPPAGTTPRALAWKLALSEIGAEDAERIVGTRGRNARESVSLDDGRWLDDTVSKLARAMVLAAEVPTRCAAVSARGEHERWEALDRLRERYESILRRAGLCDQRLDQLRRLRLATSGQPVPLADDAPEAIVLVGVLELDRAAREAIELFRGAATSRRASEPTSGVRSSSTRLPTGAEARARGRERLIVISAGDGVGLDELGTIAPDRPLSELSPERVRIDLPDECLLWAAGPASAASLTLDTIATWNSQGLAASASDVTICSPEPAFTQELAIEAAAVQGLSIHDAAGTDLSATGAGRLVHALAAYLSRRDRLTLVALCKQGLATRAIEGSLPTSAGDDWLIRLDEAAAASPRAPAESPTGISGIVATGLGSLLALEDSDDRERPLTEQAIRLGRMLGALLQSCEDRDLVDGLAGSISELGGCESLAGPMKLCDAADLLLEVMSGAVRAPEPRSDAVEVLGWLDATYDPAPNLILLGFNAGLMPARPSPNAWLNETVMGALGMFTSEHTAARDTYLLRHMLEVRRATGALRAVIARTDGEGATLWPSPLAFACDDQTAMRRAQRAGDKDESVVPVQAARVPPAERLTPGAFPVAPLVDRPMPSEVSVTAFRAYRESPYMFFLRHVAKVEEAIEPGRESDYRDLGTLVHELLSAFAGGPEAASRNPDRIFEWLRERADETLRAWPRHLVTSTQGMQQTALRRRLRRFAQMQAAHRAEGWSIAHTEWEPAQEISLDTTAGRLRLKGRIDRIDRRDDELMVIDYKVSDAVKEEKDAFKVGKKGAANEWLDLQLPLYRHMLTHSGVSANRWRLVYWSLCADKNGPKLVELSAEESDLQDASRLAVELAEKMLRGEFRELGEARDHGGSIARLAGLRLLDIEEGESAT